ncbi:hypothetical protein QEG98_37825 [Myxococcus sp. MxC21-1]|uniref:hypothetical protein n=1 Tax=Myxococcus sp. MxC21-1 TaxID=3041439 RepID=UPI00292EA7B8|nr:hypothetical protein [Myxococcus sp. MxC21-1]WNZ61562.1 hypothetical protein QEG98_37825 [Myxococcus sp. MxC21-1]
MDNDGQPDESHDSRQLLGGLLLQYKRFGIGFAMRNSVVSYCATAACAGPGERIRVSLTQSVLAGAMSFGQDDFILALGIYAAQASFRLDSGGTDLRYGDTGVAVDILYRPHGRPWRMGVTVRPEVVGDWRREPNQLPELAGRTLFGAVVSPAVLSVAPAGGWAKARSATTGCPPRHGGSSSWRETRCRCRKPSPWTRPLAAGSSAPRWTSSPAWTTRCPRAPSRPRRTRPWWARAPPSRRASAWSMTRCRA